jgi:arylsulfatase A-like enzyme
MRSWFPLAVVFLGPLCVHAFAADTTRPNVILFLIDDQDYESIATFGGKTWTPNLDRMADEGMKRIKEQGFDPDQGGVDGELVCDELVQNIDWVPTAFELAGVKPPAEYRVDGRSIVQTDKLDWPAPHSART